MKLAVRHRLLAVAPVLALAVAGCGDMQEQTQRWYPPANGVNGEAGDIGLRNVVVVADDDGRATLVAALSNRGDESDQLIDVLVADTAADLTGQLEIPADGFANISPETNRVDVTEADITPGRTVHVEFHFANAPRTEVEALVLPAEGDYADALPPVEEAPAGQATPLATEPPAPTATPGSETTPTDETTPGSAEEDAGS